MCIDWNRTGPEPTHRYLHTGLSIPIFVFSLPPVTTAHTVVSCFSWNVLPGKNLHVLSSIRWYSHEGNFPLDFFLCFPSCSPQLVPCFFFLKNETERVKEERRLIFSFSTLCIHTYGWIWFTFFTLFLQMDDGFDKKMMTRKVVCWHNQVTHHDDDPLRASQSVRL